MRQPLSIYVRAAGLAAKRFSGRVGRKMRKLAGRGADDAKPAPRPNIKLDMLAEALDTLGIVRGDRVLVHSGISALGKVVGGPKGVFNLLRFAAEGGDRVRGVNASSVVRIGQSHIYDRPHFRRRGTHIERRSAREVVVHQRAERERRK